MDVLDALQACLGQSHSAPKIRGLFEGLNAGFAPVVGRRTYVAGDVAGFGEDWVDLHALRFEPKHGFKCHSDDFLVKVVFDGMLDRCLHFCTGIQIICAGVNTSVDPSTIILKNAQVCFRPEFEPTLPWDVVHMFCGAFSGWSQAARWLDGNKTMCLGQEIFIDNDPQVMQLWNIKHSATYRTLPLDYKTAWCHAKHVGLCGSISEPSIMGACRSQVNVITTMSPPCQSWSKGGRRAGLDDQNGEAFLDALIAAFSLQTLGIAAECADDIVSHEHFKVVKALAHALGYVLVWDQVTPYHVMTTHARSRWLGVWVRFDVTLQTFPFLLHLPTFPRSRWTDQAYEFALPKRWISQLQLSPSECRTYDSIEYLPPAKRARYENKNLLHNEIIRSRVPSAAEVLPTLCASYSRQHLLAEHHLRQQGIFAMRRETAQGFSFLDPALFCSLFGSTEHVVLSEKIEESFHFVGNAITVPHSVLALSIVLHATSTCSIDPIGLVRKAWSDRLSAYNAILFAHEGFVHLIPKRDFWKWVSFKALDPPSRRCEWNLQGTCVDFPLDFKVRADQTIQEIFSGMWEAPENLLQQVCAINTDCRISNKSTVEQIARQECNFRLMIGYATLGTCELRAFPSCDCRTKVITEESDREVPCREIAIPVKDFDEYCASDLFWCIQQVVETLQDDKGKSQSEVTIVLLPEQLSIATWMSHAASKIFLQRIIDLPAIRDRCIRTRNIPGEHRSYLLATEAQKCEASVSAEIIVRDDHVNACGAILPDPCHPVSFLFSGATQSRTIQCVNGQTVSNNLQRLCDGDIVDVCCPRPVHAGGHHLNTRAPPSLPALSDFTARVEFMCDTNGWVASDEMYHYTQALQWQQNWLRFATLQMWDASKGDFEEPVFGELDIPNNATTAIPVLIGSHWAGIEITRRGTETSVTFIQVPVNLHTALTFLVARLIDVAPHRFQVQCEVNEPQPHTCGWDLIFRWYRRHGIHQGIADISNHIQLNAEYTDLIQVALQCSSEDWATAQINFEVGQLAFNLRKNFLCSSWPDVNGRVDHILKLRCSRGARHQFHSSEVRFLHQTCLLHHILFSPTGLSLQLTGFDTALHRFCCTQDGCPQMNLT